MTQYRSDSMYKNTKIVENKFLDVYQSPVPDIADLEVDEMVLEAKYNQRPDKLAFDLYGNAKLWWVFAEINQDKLVDPIIDFKSGITIKYPVRFS